MPDSLQPLIQELLNSNDLVAAVLATVIVLVLMLFLFRTPLKDWRQERGIRKAIRRLGARSLENVHLPDGTGGEVTIEHLLLGRDAIIVVGVMRYDGQIFGGPKTDQWTQVINRRSYKFDNPDHYLQRQLYAVGLIAPGASVRGWHLFGHAAEFPRDKPDNVMQPGDVSLPPKRPRRGDIPKQLRAAWEQLVDYAEGQSTITHR